MRQVQKGILTTIAQRLSIHSVPTKVSDDGLAYFTTEDKQTSIALQVGVKMSSVPHLSYAHSPVLHSPQPYTGRGKCVYTGLQVGEAEKIEWLVASCTALVYSPFPIIW